MQEREYGWAAAIGATITLMIFAALALTIAGQWHWFSDAAAASWAQAIVATVALAAGAGGLYWQAGENRRLETARLTSEEARRLRIMFGAVFDLRARLEASTWHEFGPYQTEWRRVDEAVELLRTIPLLEVPDWQVAFSIRQAVDSYALLRRWIPPATNAPPSKEWFARTYELTDTAVLHSWKAQQHIREALERRKASVPTIEIQFEGGTLSSNDEP